MPVEKSKQGELAFEIGHTSDDAKSPQLRLLSLPMLFSLFPLSLPFGDLLLLGIVERLLVLVPEHEVEDDDTDDDNDGDGDDVLHHF